MAAGIMAAPGTEYGPCADACEHTDCAATRKRAQSICFHCKKPIGYGVRFYDVGKPGAMTSVHALCEEIAIEKEQREKQS